MSAWDGARQSVGATLRRRAEQRGPGVLGRREYEPGGTSLASARALGTSLRRCIHMGLEEETLTIAHALVDLRGPNSGAYADQRIREADALGDSARAAKWRRVRQLVRDLVRKNEENQGFDGKND